MSRCTASCSKSSINKNEPASGDAGFFLRYNEREGRLRDESEAIAPSFSVSFD
ncbi:3-hydroxymyristoyl-(acyl carrier protein) dehydratase [Bacillus velezensis YAU B9601-Y2]|uniref:3-hydroxymyristoyl-(Acyl carrier protein) dehydratase n=1 Tax=Bacillus amyloliquefaciens (strain Y2) TaxID=1155777 RepID=I2C1E8_BACAY|nr:3-hydroxymyristoyl-(acyl carrier protein) dehydratase [Bacillus velezensis YAU B9601-Y2]